MSDSDLALRKLQELRLLASDARAAMVAAQEALNGAELHSLSVCARRDAAEGRLRLRGLSDQEAERLTARLRALPGVREVRLEQWVRP